MADKLAASGVDIFQLRDKDLADAELLRTAEKLSKILHKGKKLLIINDRADIASLCGADGLHLGAKDLSPVKARKIMGPQAIIGKTVHSLAEVKAFSKEKIDYISIGPVFRTKTKPNLTPLTIKKLQSIARKSEKLTFAIGGISLYNINSLVKIGINNIAVCRGIILQKNFKSAIKKYKQCLKKAS